MCMYLYPQTGDGETLLSIVLKMIYNFGKDGDDRTAIVKVVSKVYISIPHISDRLSSNDWR